MRFSALVGAQLLMTTLVILLGLALGHGRGVTAQTASSLIYWDDRLDGLGVSLIPAADCTNGCWRLTSARYQDETQSGGTHHIYIEEPHDLSRYAEISNGNETWHIQLEKPQGEPAGNYAMSAANVYSAAIYGAPSDRVVGMKMRGPTDDTAWQAHHVSYFLTWVWADAEAPAVLDRRLFVPLALAHPAAPSPSPTATATASLPGVPTTTPTVTTTPPSGGLPYTGSVVQTFDNCGLTQILGVVEDANGTPLPGISIRLTWDGGQTYFARSGDKQEFGPSGWDIVLATFPQANVWRVAVVDAANNPLSSELSIRTDGICDPGSVNVAKVRFVRAP